MLSIGLSGGFNRYFDNTFELPRSAVHDGAAALVENGEIVTAIEEERLNRIKHSNKFPEHALRYCLDRRGLDIQDVDRFSFYSTEECADALLAVQHLNQRDLLHRVNARTLLCQLLSEAFDHPIDPARIVFKRHHLCHGASASALSGFERSLVLAIDGFGDFLSGVVATAESSSLTEIASLAENQSLGVLYVEVIRFLGYQQFDEYKVMGLAPYGDPAVYRPVLRRLYELLPNGDYALHLDRVVPVMLGAVEVRKTGQPVTRRHMDLAAALQEALETIVLHVLRHYRAETRLRKLCLAGGVALNCTMNGRIARSGLFDDVFVQPAAHDAGCALGGALLAAHDEGYPAKCGRLQHVYWGTDIGGQAEVEAELKAWQGFLRFERSDEVTREAAALLAGGEVLGWVQGRSEFGPRALGNRSILADPRPAENRERINQMVKKREAFRPFAPSVLEEDAAEFFDLPEGFGALPFMLFVVDVRPDKRALLPATTHIDGTARVQTVSRATNRRYWDLIAEFKELTGIPVLLNTSFNNNVEPIVDSTADAVVSFLTTELDRLVIGDFVVRKRTPAEKDWLALRVSLPPHIEVRRTKGFVSADRAETVSELRSVYDSVRISSALGELLAELDGEQMVGELLDQAHASERPALIEELARMWALRKVRLRP
jgi:carbamoyltransferase